MLRLLAAMMALLSIAFAGTPTQQDESVAECAHAEAVAVNPALRRAALKVVLEHEGMEVDVVLCVLDEDGRKVAETTGTARGRSQVVLSADLPIGVYVTVTEVDSTSLLPGGNAALNQQVDLADCKRDITVARGKTHYYPWGSGIEGDGVDCVKHADRSRSEATGTITSPIVRSVR